MNEIDLAFPIADGRLVRVDHAHEMAGAVKSACPQLAELQGWGLHPLRGDHLGGGVLHLRPRAPLRLRLPAAAVPLALPLAGRELRVGSCLLRLGAPRIEVFAPHAQLYARMVTLAKTLPVIAGGSRPRGNRPASAEEVIAAAKAAVNPEARVRVLRQHSMSIRRAKIVGYEIVIEELSPQHSLALQAQGLGGRRAFGCGIFVNAGSRRAVVVADQQKQASQAERQADV